MQLNLGCGKRQIPGFVHVDLADFPHIDYKQDVRDLSCFGDHTVELIYACHVLEYFDREEALRVLTEWKRVLKPGGIIRLAVPDAEALFEVYRRTRDLSLILGPLYGRSSIQETASDVYLYHKTIYDFTSLKQALESCGFSDVRKYDWRKTIHKDYDDFSQAYFPHMDKENGLLISLNVEAIKLPEHP